MRSCCFLTMNDLEGFYTYDELLVEPLAERGWSVNFVSWRDGNIDWDEFEVVIIRSPWDYQDDPALFMKVLEEIDSSGARLENSLEIVKWNINKTYLRDMQQRGIKIVPSLWYNNWKKLDTLRELFTRLDTEELVIKPLISANADHTYRLFKNTFEEKSDLLEKTFRNRPFMIQPFVDSIVTEGEYSLFYFGDEYSHAIVKKPEKGDFRVQEEHGGTLHTLEPDTKLLELGDKTIQNITPLPLYSRIDFVRLSDKTYALMELELIEPSLYFNMDPESPERFARIFDEWIKQKT